MQLYIAGLINSHFHKTGRLYATCPPNAKLLRDQIQYQLESYHYLAKGSSQVRNLRADGVKIFLDSGAFSAFTLGHIISIEEYAEFIKEGKDFIHMASVLDAIGDPEGTFHNQNALEKMGVEVLPCFHYGEPFDLCEYYVRNYDYITIGGMVPIPNSKLKPWLDELWDKVLTDKDGYSRIKVHGFGLTARVLMERYPWYSVDSSSWVQAASTGRIVLPEFDMPISVSKRSPTLKVWGQHFDSYPDVVQQKVVERLHYYGLTLDDVQLDYKPRWALNAFTYDRLGRLMGDDHWRKPFAHSYNGLF